MAWLAGEGSAWDTGTGAEQWRMAHPLMPSISTAHGASPEAVPLHAHLVHYAKPAFAQLDGPATVVLKEGVIKAAIFAVAIGPGV